MHHDHFAAPNEEALHQVDPLQAEPFFPTAVDRIIVRNGNVTLRLHDGFAFDNAATNESAQSASGSVASDTATKQADDNAPMAGFIEFRGRKINISVDQYPLDASYAMRIVVLVDQLEILDRVSLDFVLSFFILYFFIQQTIFFANTGSSVNNQQVSLRLLDGGLSARKRRPLAAT